jgi:hypothetical protein
MAADATYAAISFPLSLVERGAGGVGRGEVLNDADLRASDAVQDVIRPHTPQPPLHKGEGEARTTRSEH